ncbi:hypothetical protein CO610_08930 [Lysobacteraceae bacterium NML95-0200]|nr:hypothetical protein CO610_08930 [Xanthomonadaceae bacterium NML95-0200]
MSKSRSSPHHLRLRQQLASTAARLMAENHINDFHHARRKAAALLGIHTPAFLPDNAEIEQALRDYRRLFRDDTQHQALLHTQRQAALQAMRFLQAFEPRLTGAALEGYADTHSAICLHLHCDTPEMVSIFLHEHGIPAQSRIRRIRLDRQHSADVDVWTFTADQTAFELVVLPLSALHQPPLAEGDNHPANRASLAQLRKLLGRD